MGFWTKEVAQEMERQGARGLDPRHVEGYIRLAFPTMGNMSPSEFRREVEIGIACVQMAPSAEAETLAKSWGL
jgi:hypothetical protein